MTQNYFNNINTKIMNYKILKQYNIKFVNINGRKQVSFKGRSIIERYIYIYQSVEDVNLFLNEISLAESGQFEKSEFLLFGSNPQMIDYGASDGGAYISGRIFQNSITLYENEIIKDTVTIPLSDWKEILLSWKEFLLS